MPKTEIAIRAGIAACILLVVGAGAAPKARQAKTLVPKEVEALQGTYTGEWTLYGIDAKGQVVRSLGWTDTVTSENPTRQGDRAYVTTTDTMTFEGGHIPPRKYQVTEGYFLQKDGHLGDYFIASSGEVTRLHRLDPDTWAYTAKPDPHELAAMGFSNVLSAQHVLVKVIASEQGKETHRITRLTTVHWKDAEGKERWLQFVSLQGYHRRQSP